ncbi:hypothetical protein D3C71_1384560 [compost metagenome]
MPNITTQEYLALRRAELHRSKLIAHTVLHDHGTHDARSLLEVTVCARTDLTNKQFFGNTSTK